MGDDDVTSCDVRAYCDSCISSDLCVTLLNEGHAGNISNVAYSDDAGEFWHEGQAENLLLALDSVCVWLERRGFT